MFTIINNNKTTPSSTIYSTKQDITQDDDVMQGKLYEEAPNNYGFV